MIAKLRSHLRAWPEIVWLAVIGLLVLALFAALKRFDPHSGIDGFGGLFALGLGLIEGIAITAMAWLCKRTYTHDWDDSREFAAHALAKKPCAEGNGARWLLVIDRAEWAGWLVLWYLLLH